MRDWDSLNYLELVRKVYRLSKIIDALVMLLSEKGVATYQELDATVSEVEDIADEKFEDDICKKLLGIKLYEDGSYVEVPPEGWGKFGN